MSLTEIVVQKVEEIKKALAEGRVVMVGGVVVKSIDVVKAQRSVIIIINNELTMYPSRFIASRIEVI
ncbi:MAG: hypothetical protein ACP5MH_11080 [Thermoproteus sp.]